MSVANGHTLVSAWRKISLIGGILSILLGLILLTLPRVTALVLTALIGVWLLVLGFVRLLDAFAGRRSGQAGNPGRGFAALAGAVYILAGVIVLVDLDRSVRYLAIMFGLIWICAGLSEAMAGVARVGGAWVRTAALLTGVVDISLGILVLLLPSTSLAVLVTIAAAWLILLGLVQLYASHQAHRATRELRGRPS